MINRILICLDKSTYTDSAMEFACWLAKKHDASIEGLVVLDMEGIERSVGAVPLGAMKFAKTSIAAKEKECHQLIEELLGKFTNHCDAVGVRHTEFEMQGAPAEAILAESNYFDCVVIGLRTFFTYSSGAGEDEVYGTADDEPGDSLEEIMDQSLAPVFAVPLTWQPDDEFDVLIALNGSVHSMRALRQFAGLYGHTKVNITLLHCSDGSVGHLEILTKSAAYLRAHGFDHVVSRTESGEIRDVLDDEFIAPFDLVVLGAHGNKSAVVEFFTGSLCKKLIERQSKPLLIASGWFGFAIVRVLETLISRLKNVSIFLLFCSFVSAADIRVVVWDEQQPCQKHAYDNSLGNTTADHLKTLSDMEVRSIKQDDPNKGIGSDVLDHCDVLIWWGHKVTEMYDEPDQVSKPDQVIFKENFGGGEWFRSGGVWNLGKGKVFYFRPGHETYPVFKEKLPLRVIENAVRWLAAELPKAR